MIIDSLTMRNFRLFEEAHIDFHDRVSVVVGVNGAGKSSVLDAMSILLSCYVGGFDGFAARRIAQSDIRHVTHKIGSFSENVPQLPAEVSAAGSICSERVSWGGLKLKDSPQSSSPSAYDELTRVAAEHQRRLREGDESLVLPLVAYYGTGRLWKRDPSKKRHEDKLNAPFRRLAAYEECLDAHVTDTALVTFYERMTFKQLQRGSVSPEQVAVADALEKGLKTLAGVTLHGVSVNFDTHELVLEYEDNGVPMRMLDDPADIPQDPVRGDDPRHERHIVRAIQPADNRGRQQSAYDRQELLRQGCQLRAARADGSVRATEKGQGAVRKVLRPCRRRRLRRGAKDS